MLDQEALDLLFNEARTHNSWQDRPVPDSLLSRAYELARMGPTSMNCQPQRIVFIRSSEAKEKLRRVLSPGNVEKTMAAPATAVLALDPNFHEFMPRLFPPFPGARDSFEQDPALKESTMMRNGTLQAGYFIMACRAVGLDCGPMSGFDQAGLDELFFAGSGYKSNFLCNLGFGDPAGIHPRGERFPFEEACRLL